MEMYHHNNNTMDFDYTMGAPVGAVLSQTPPKTDYMHMAAPSSSQSSGGAAAGAGHSTMVKVSPSSSSTSGEDVFDIGLDLDNYREEQIEPITMESRKKRTASFEWMTNGSADQDFFFSTLSYDDGFEFSNPKNNAVAVEGHQSPPRGAEPSYYAPRGSFDDSFFDFELPQIPVQQPIRHNNSDGDLTLSPRQMMGRTKVEETPTTNAFINAFDNISMMDNITLPTNAYRMATNNSQMMKTTSQQAGASPVRSNSKTSLSVLQQGANSTTTASKKKAASKKQPKKSSSSKRRKCVLSTLKISSERQAELKYAPAPLYNVDTKFPSRLRSTRLKAAADEAQRRAKETHNAIFNGTLKGDLSSLVEYDMNGNKIERIGAYTLEERRKRIARFHQKRKKRVWTKKIKYNCRKKLAEGRPRVKGRFVKTEEEEDENVSLDVTLPPTFDF